MDVKWSHPGDQPAMAILVTSSWWVPLYHYIGSLTQYRYIVKASSLKLDFPEGPNSVSVAALTSRLYIAVSIVGPMNQTSQVLMILHNFLDSQP